MKPKGLGILIFSGLITVLLPKTNYASATWPGEPAGADLLGDFDFCSKTGGGWNSSGNFTTISDGAAPLSSPCVAQYNYPVGFQAGSAPAGHWHSLNGNQYEGYVGFWWKASVGWQQESNSKMSKIAFYISNGAFDIYWGMAGTSAPFFISFRSEAPTICNGHTGTYGENCGGTRVFDPNVNTTPIFPGNWYRIELYHRFSATSTSKDGIVRLWVNGVLNLNYTNVNFPRDIPLVEFKISPTWGGLNNTKTQNDYFYFDHVHLSLPHGGSTAVFEPSPTVHEVQPPLSVKTSSGKTRFMVNGESRLAKISIFDLNGRIVWQHTGVGGNHSGPVEWNHAPALGNGLYVARLQDERSSVSVKFCTLR